MAPYLTRALEWAIVAILVVHVAMNVRHFGRLARGEMTTYKLAEVRALGVALVSWTAALALLVWMLLHWRECP